MNKTLTELADHLLAHRDNILKEWVQVVQRSPDFTSASRLGNANFAGHLPELFENIAARLKDPSADRDGAVSRAGRRHGGFRWAQGYRLEEIIREASIIRRILFRNWLDSFASTCPQFDNETRRLTEDVIHGAIDDVIADSAEQYLEEQQKSVIHLNSRLADEVAELRQQKDGR
jgi:hypothetical protein